MMAELLDCQSALLRTMYIMLNQVAPTA
ncbi:MAG: hypothetical protein RLZZ180_1768, partial [Pseudomonadota bacterium]